MENHMFKDVSRVNLSELHVLPTLVNGKVVVINNDKSYTMYKLFDDCIINDGFDPTDYDLCRADFYTYGNHRYELVWDNNVGRHVRQCTGSDKIVQYTTYRIGSASSYSKRIAKARIEQKLVEQAYQAHLAKNNCDKCEYNTSYDLKPGDKIHIKSRQGIYEVVSCDYYTITITCKRWSVDGSKPIKIISRQDFKCLAGGLHNWSR
jgi:hypothetical protein